MTYPVFPLGATTSSVVTAATSISSRGGARLGKTVSMADRLQPTVSISPHKTAESLNRAAKMPTTSNAIASGLVIQEVWGSNLEMAIEIISELVLKYPYLAMDTEYPGIVARPIGNFKTPLDYHYQTLRCNVDMLRIIQLGISFADQKGNLAPGVCTFQFNFKFNLSDDMYAQESIDLLAKSGINFQKHQEYGIDVSVFGELLMSSGLVLNNRVKWISFHSGYDFGYLLKMVTCELMPTAETDFFTKLRMFFPCFYDIKCFMKQIPHLQNCGLQELANELQVDRIGIQHQAGSDSLLTLMSYFKMRQKFFSDSIDDSRFACHLYGLNSVAPANAANPAILPISSSPATPAVSRISRSNSSVSQRVLSTTPADQNTPVASIR